MYIIDKLDNGIKVVMENIEYVNSVTIGIIIDTGSVKENNINNGVSHFIEHMIFKGTNKRTPKQIAEAIDDIGGQLNAFTGKEQTCYFAKVLDQHLPIAIDVISDMLNNSLFLKEDIEKERMVIIEEINMYQDSPEDLVFELLNDIMFEGTPLEYPILGVENTVLNLQKHMIEEYFHNNYDPKDMIISLAGKFNAKQVMEMLNQAFNSFNQSFKKTNDKVVKVNYDYKNKIRGISKDIEQLNFCIGMEGVENTSDDIHPILVLNNLFGGSMSSRLFQKIREDRGLTYAVDSHLSTYNETGVFGIYAGLNSENLIEVTGLINDEINLLRKHLITPEELRKSKEQLKGNYILGTEGTFSRMIENGKSISLLNRVETPKEIIDKIDKVSMDDIDRVVSKVFQRSKINFAYVGKLDKHEEVENQIKEILF